MRSAWRGCGGGRGEVAVARMAKWVAGGGGGEREMGHICDLRRMKMLKNRAGDVVGRVG